MKMSIRVFVAILVVISPNLIFESFQSYPRWEDAIEIALFQILAIAWFEAIMLACDAQDYLNSDEEE